MKSLIYLSFSFVRAERPDARLLATSNSVAGEVKHVEEFCAMYDICGARSDRKVLNCPYNIPSVKPDDLLSSKVQSLCPTITGNVCCTEDQFDTLRTQVQQAIPFLVGCPACLRNFLNLFCELTCSPNQSLFINVTSVSKVSNNLTVDGIDYYITDTFGQGLYESCKDVKFGTMNTRALDFIGGGAQNFKDWFAFIGRRAAANLPGSPYTIKFWPSAPELSGMIPMNVSAYSCADGSLGCSCGDCTSSPVCSSTAPPPHKSSSCSVKMGSLNAKCVDFALAILYIILVSLFFGWGFFHRKRERSRSFRMKPLVNAMDGSELHSVERQKEENLPMQVQMLGTPRTRNRIQLSIVQGYMSNFYRKYGKWVARNPTLVLSLSMALVLLLCLGLIRFEVETRPEKLWVGPGSRAAEEKLFFDSHLAPFYRIEEIDGLRANYSGSMISLTDICMKPLGQDCATQSVLQYFKMDPKNFDDFGGVEHVKYCFQHYTSTESCMSAFKGPLDPSTALGGFSGNNYSEASAFVVTYPVNNAVDREGNETKKAVAWEKAFVQLAKDELLPMVQSKNLTLAFSSESSIEEELKRESTADAITIVISYLVMFAYISLTLGDTPHLSSFYISSKVLLGLSGVVLVMLSVLGSVGFFSAIGVKSTLIIMEVIPFLVLAVGVDNMCILVHAVKRQQLELPLETRISNALVEVGPSITLASLSEVLAFAVGSFIPMPACRVFSMFAALAVLLDFLLQITAFVALIVFDFLRAEDKRVDCIPCLKLSSSYADSDKGIGQRKPGLLARYMKEVHATILSLWGVKIAVISLFVAFTLASIGYFNNISEHLRIGPPLYFVVKNYNYSSESRQTNQLCSISQCDSNSLLNEISRASLIPQSSYIAKPAASWLDDFLVWISPEAFGCCRKFTNGSYCPPDDQCFHHSDLLKDRPSTIQFKEKLPWFLNALPSASCAKGGHGAYTNSVDLKGYENGIVQASSFRTYHTPLNRQIDYVNSMRAAREFSSRVSDSLQMEIFPYSVFYMYFEQYLDIWRTALINLAIAIGAVFVVCLITTCSFWSSAIILLVLTMIVVDLMGVMAILKIQLNAVSVVNLVMAVGIAVEFCVHITHAFSVSKQWRQKPAHERGSWYDGGFCLQWNHAHKASWSYRSLLLKDRSFCGLLLPNVPSSGPSRFLARPCISTVHFSQTRESFNGRSTANRLLRWLWLVRKDRENCGEQNSSGGVTGNWRNNGELKRGFCDFSRLRLAAFRMLYGDKDDMEMTGITRASDQYQPWPVELPETKTKSGSGSRVGLTRLFL
ncbi:SSD domain-containing protein [Citrus sinensis]|uniref:SSD domain-containing protein n=1 Tax=Citrus sinensis TaxID=2711 RepID=A0ACB8KYL5_CITSI|nr:SSD domain-containing protein [Citrus sinensis]